MTGEHSVHGEAGGVAHLCHVIRRSPELDALVGFSVNQAAVQHTVALTRLDIAALIQIVGREDVVIIDSTAGQEPVVQNGPTVEVKGAFVAGEDQADGGAVEGALPGCDIAELLGVEVEAAYVLRSRCR